MSRKKRTAIFSGKIIEQIKYLFKVARYILLQDEEGQKDLIQGNG